MVFTDDNCGKMASYRKKKRGSFAALSSRAHTAAHMRVVFFEAVGLDKEIN